MKIRLRWPRRKESRQGVSDAREIRERSERDLASTKRQLASEYREVVEPLQRKRQHMIRENHVYDELTRQLGLGDR